MRRAVRKLHAGSLGKPLGFCRLAPLLTVMALSMLYCFKLQMQSSLVTSRLRISISSSDLPYTWQELRAAAAAKQCRGPEPDEVVPDLVAVRQWHSCKPRQQESITIVTQLSLERLEMLENQCSTWPDPIAAVVYIPTLQGRIFSLDDLTLNGTHLGAAVTRVGQFVERMQQHASCVLDVELATQDFGEGAEAALYPVNAVRNRALMLARTQALLLLDADFVASPTMLAPYKTPQGYAELLQRLDRPEAIVLPAFETASEGYSGKTLALKAARKGKAVAVKKYRNGRMRGFKQHLFVAGHRQTNYTRWVSQDENYKIKYKKNFEPYVLVSRHWVPWYDERFRGYGHNKIQHIMHLVGLNTTFTVHGTGFVVHVPHKRGESYLASKHGQWRKNGLLYRERVVGEISSYSFVPVTSFPQLCVHPQPFEQHEGLPRLH